MSKFLINRWKKVKPDKIASAIYKVVNNDLSQLTESFEEVNSVWGKIALSLGSSFKSKVDRQWLKTTYEENTKGVKTLVCDKCQLATNESEVGSCATSRQSGPIKQPCGVCRKLEGDIPSYPMIKCSICSKWFHCSCAKVTKKVFESPEDWHCPKCLLQESCDFIPHIFNRTVQNSPVHPTSNQHDENQEPRSQLGSQSCAGGTPIHLNVQFKASHNY